MRKLIYLTVAATITIIVLGLPSPSLACSCPQPSTERSKEVLESGTYIVANTAFEQFHPFGGISHPGPQIRESTVQAKLLTTFHGEKVDSLSFEAFIGTEGYFPEGYYGAQLHTASCDIFFSPIYKGLMAFRLNEDGKYEPVSSCTFYMIVHYLQSELGEGFWRVEEAESDL